MKPKIGRQPKNEFQIKKKTIELDQNLKYFLFSSLVRIQCEESCHECFEIYSPDSKILKNSLSHVPKDAPKC